MQIGEHNNTLGDKIHGEREKKTTIDEIVTQQLIKNI